MRANLDQWIKNSKADVPESGEYRRLNRAMLKERIAAMAPRRRRHHRVLLGFLSLVFLMLFSGQLNKSDRDELNRSVAANEGKLVKVTGLSYGGKTTWNKFIRMNINDKEIIPGGRPENPSSEFPDNYFEFLQAHYSDLEAKTNSVPPHRTERIIVDGVMMDFKIWTFEFPGYGLVTRYLGTPV